MYVRSTYFGFIIGKFVTGSQIYGSRPPKNVTSETSDIRRNSYLVSWQFPRLSGLFLINVGTVDAFKNKYDVSLSTHYQGTVCVCALHTFFFSTALTNGGTLGPFEIKHNILLLNPYLCTTYSHPISLDAAHCYVPYKVVKQLIIREVNLFKTQIALKIFRLHSKNGFRLSVLYRVIEKDGRDLKPL